MSNLSFLFRTDCHVADKSPESWKGDYVAEVWNSLEQVGQLAQQYGCRAVLDGGDFFHVKAAARTSHASVIKAVLTHRQYPCPTYSIEGNHDLAYNNLDSIERQPLGVLYQSKVFSHLREEVFIEGGLQVRVVGVPYSFRRTLDELLAIQKKPGDDYLIAIVHALASNDPPSSVEDFLGEPVFRYADLATPDGPDVWMFGHWHRDQGIEEVRGKRFVNQGALSRGALNHENITRTPQVSLVSFGASGITTKVLPLVVAPPEDVFDFERKERVESEVRSIDSFVSLLQSEATFDPNQTLDQNIAALGFAVEVRDAALHYLELARSK